ncbi:probable choline kinase 2 isoform X4 [Rutidosis leptorrhynchoides]|uniref:probable choline kinase 2 isoform X4 n=1 Tax=Rutidosis leptorrhynchoides TaxID=125765 RepID=UPI003A98D31C
MNTTATIIISPSLFPSRALNLNPYRFHRIHASADLITCSFISSQRLENSSRAVYHKRAITSSKGDLVMESAEKVDAIGSRLPAEAMTVLKSLASRWDDIVDIDALQVVRLKGAMTNEVYQIKWPTNRERSRKVLVRIYGEGVDLFFDRETEIRTFEFMSKQGQGPRLLGRFSNGRIEEFIRARTLSACDLRDHDTSALIASKLKEFHDLDMPGPKEAMVWSRLRHFLGAAKSMCSSEEVKTLRLDAMEEEIETLHNYLVADQRIAFCHNDLQYGNIMIDEDTRSITIIVKHNQVQTKPRQFLQKQMDIFVRITSMLVTILSCSTLQITFVRWLLIIIQRHLMCWIIANTQVLMSVGSFFMYISVLQVIP